MTFFYTKVLMNQAAMHSRLDDLNRAKYLLSLATEVKSEKRHDVVHESLKRLQVNVMHLLTQCVRKHAT